MVVDLDRVPVAILTEDVAGGVQGDDERHGPARSSRAPFRRRLRSHVNRAAPEDSPEPKRVLALILHGNVAFAVCQAAGGLIDPVRKRAMHDAAADSYA